MGHGVEVVEQPTGVKPPVRISEVAVYVGTAPINSVDLTNVNKPKLSSTLAEFEAAFGPLSDDFESWTLHEAAKAHFSVYSVGPIVCVNILDPENAGHVASVAAQSHQLIAGEVQLQVYGGPDAPQLGVLADTVVVAGSALGIDYTLEFDDDGYLVVSIVEGGNLNANSVISVSFDYLDPTGVTADDIIGGVSGGAYSGIDVVHQVFPSLRKVTGFISAPKWNSTPEVAARLGVVARSVSGTFRAMAATDLSTDAADIPTYADAPAWKTDNGFTSVDSMPCWPKIKNGDDVYHGSTVLICVAMQTDSEVEDIPYRSPSNKKISGTAAVLDDGTEVLLTRDQANDLNAQGIVTFRNGLNGWRTWGNRTGGYPGTTDPKDSFIPIRRMFNRIGNTVILTTDENVDDPLNRRLVDLVQGTLQSYLNGLIAQGALVDGVIEFREDENLVGDLADGKIKWHLKLTPPPPAEELSFVLEYDPDALASLFA